MASGEVISIIRHLTIWHKSAQLKGARMEGGWRGWGRVGGHPEEKLAIKYEKMLQLFSKWSFQRGYCGNADVAPERAPCRCASAMTRQTERTVRCLPHFPPLLFNRGWWHWWGSSIRPAIISVYTLVWGSEQPAGLHLVSFLGVCSDITGWGWVVKR